MGSGCLRHIFYISNRLLPKIPIILYILFNNFSPGKLILRKIRLDAVFGPIFKNFYLFTEHVFLWIEFPVIVTVLLLAALIVAVGSYVEGLDLWIFLDLNIVWCYDVFCDIIIEVGLVSVGEIRVVDSFRELVVSGEGFC